MTVIWVLNFAHIYGACKIKNSPCVAALVCKIFHYLYALFLFMVVLYFFSELLAPDSNTPPVMDFHGFSWMTDAC